MSKQHKVESVAVAFLAFIAVGMSVGFAAYSQQLNVTGTTTVAKNKWEITFDQTKDSVQENRNGVIVNSDSVVIGSEDALTESVNYAPDSLSVTTSIKLKNPIDEEKGTKGDSVHYEIPIKNSGTFDATLTGVKITGIDGVNSKYLKSRVQVTDKASFGENSGKNYDSGEHIKSEINATADNGLQPLIIKANASASTDLYLIVDIAYIAPADYKELPQEETAIQVGVELNFTQK